MIVLDEYTKYFHRGSINEVIALKDFSLNVKNGDFITIIGSNGAGKSTLLNGIAGVFLPDSGKITLNDTNITNWPEHRRAAFIGRVFQDPLLGTCGALSIEQNMAIAAKRGKHRGLSIGVKSKHRKCFQAELKKLDLGLEDRLHDKVGLLSGGQRQALTLLMASLVRPNLLLLDEHTAALDPKTANQILDLTKEIIEKENLTTLMVTHNMNQALQFGNRLIMLHQGKTLLDVKAEEKQKLTVENLISKFYASQGDNFASDRMVLI